MPTTIGKTRYITEANFNVFNYSTSFQLIIVIKYNRKTTMCYSFSITSSSHQLKLLSYEHLTATILTLRNRKVTDTFLGFNWCQNNVCTIPDPLIRKTSAYQYDANIPPKTTFNKTSDSFNRTTMTNFPQISSDYLQGGFIRRNNNDQFPATLFSVSFFHKGIFKLVVLIMCGGAQSYSSYSACHSKLNIPQYATNV